MVRHSLNYVSWKKQRKEVAADLKTDLSGSNGPAGRSELGAVRGKMGRHPSDHQQMLASELGKDHSPVFLSSRRFARRSIRPTPSNLLNMSLRKVTKNRGSFPSDEAMLKLLYLALEEHCQKMGLCRSGTGNRPLTSSPSSLENRMPDL